MERIDDYLNGIMSDQERSSFEAEMASDGDLAEKVNEVKLTNEAIYFASLAELKESIGNDIKGIKYNSGPRFSKTFLFSGLAFLIGALAAIYFINKETFSKNTNTRSNVVIIKDTILSDTLEPLNETSLTPENESDSIKRNLEIYNPGLYSENPMVYSDTIKEHIVDTSIILNDPTVDSNNKIVGSESDKILPDIDYPVIENENQEVSSPDMVNICDQSFKFESLPTCKGNSTGEISIANRGDNFNSIKINHLNENSSNGLISGLPAGIYEVEVSYNKECVYKAEVTVDEKWCPLNSSYSFNPDFGEKWEIKYSDGDQGDFIIFDNFGKEVYKNTFGSGNEYWNGVDKYGSIVPLGTYIAIINYSDGRKEKVELTIVR